MIVKDDLRILKENQHIGMACMAWINEAQRHRHEIGSWPVNLRPDIHPGMGGITAGQLYNLNVPMQIERKKMAGHRSGLVADERIHLKGSRPAIVEIVQSNRDPPADKLPQHNNPKHNRHAKANRQPADRGKRVFFLALLCTFMSKRGCSRCARNRYLLVPADIG
jgi:hypothetical protein